MSYLWEVDGDELRQKLEKYNLEEMKIFYRFLLRRLGLNRHSCCELHAQRILVTCIGDISILTDAMRDTERYFNRLEPIIDGNELVKDKDQDNDRDSWNDPGEVDPLQREIDATWH